MFLIATAYRTLRTELNILDWVTLYAKKTTQNQKSHIT